MKEIRIKEKLIGLNHPTYFVADIGANHDGDLERAKELIRLAAESGADAAKFQNFAAKTIVSDRGFKDLRSQKSHQTNWQKSVYEVYDAASLPLEWTQELKETCDKECIHYFTAPYESSFVKQISNQVCAWKIGSGDITWHSHIEELSKDGKPVMLATGASEMREVKAAVDLILKYNHDLVLMQCNTNYTGAPENFENVALNVLKTYAVEYPEAVLGLSDHTPGHVTVLGSVTLGARVIEKHFTDDNSREGPDHPFSMNPKTWKEMVEATRLLELALGPEEKRVMPNEEETVVVQRRAIRASRAIAAGETIDRTNTFPLRPCPKDGIPPDREIDILGKRCNKAIEEGDCIRFVDLM